MDNHVIFCAIFTCYPLQNAAGGMMGGDISRKHLMGQKRYVSLWARPKGKKHGAKDTRLQL